MKAETKVIEKIQAAEDKIEKQKANKEISEEEYQEKVGRIAKAEERVAEAEAKAAEKKAN
jgi:hypothetical protein